MDNNEYDEIPETEEQDEVQYDNLTDEESSYEAINNRQRYIENETAQANQRRSLRPNILNMIGRNNDVSKAIKNKMDNLNQRNQIEKDKKEESEKDKPDKDSEDAKQEKKSENKTKNKVNLNNIKSVISADNETRKKLLQKKIIAFIMKNPWVLVIILSLFLLFLILIIILGGAGGADDNDYDISLSNGNACSEMPIYGTSLSKSEFVEKIQSYFNKNDKWSSKIYDNAENIYKIATKNGINPELVVTRAVLEHGDSDYSTNNYWGIAVFNGASSGSTFSTFSEGVLAFVNIVKQYSEAFEMMMSYAYIGTYWTGDDTKTGGNCGPGYGGCYYLPYTKKYYDNEDDYKKAETICNNTKCKLERNNGMCNVVDASKCTKTRSTGSDNVDQVAYAKYQVSKMAEKRKLIFGLEPNDCSSYTDIDNINDIRELGTLIAKKAVETFDHYQYSQSLRNKPGYVDCSSMVDRAYRLFGIDYLYGGKEWGNAGTTDTESDWCKKTGAVVNSTNVNDFLPGDIIFNNNWGHVVLYIGNGQIFEASKEHDDNPELDVRIDNYYGGTVMVCRPLRVYFREKGTTGNE